MKTERLEDTAAKGVAAINTIVQERDRLLTDNERMRVDIALLKQRNDQLEGRLETAATERDHYMRFSTELVTKINAMQMVFEDAIRGAKHAAFKPPLVPKPQPFVKVDTDNIESLIKRLPMNGGGGDANPVR
jgi:hypothetical protein